jgi:hypothetical protein
MGGCLVWPQNLTTFDAKISHVLILFQMTPSKQMTITNSFGHVISLRVLSRTGWLFTCNLKWSAAAPVQTAVLIGPSIM